MGQCFFTSDLHLGHVFMAKIRGFNTVKEHDEFIISQLEKHIHRRDKLWVLGDVAYSRQALDLLNRLLFTKEVVLGNHDHFKAHVYLYYFSDVRGVVQYKNKYVLTHVPMHPQELRDKINVHGHLHKNRRYRRSYHK